MFKSIKLALTNTKKLIYDENPDLVHLNTSVLITVAIAIPKTPNGNSTNLSE